MDMPGRTCLNTNQYRYGYGGKEKDKDIIIGSLDFGARIYDARIGRWLSVDPLAKKYPNESPYIYSGNSPVYMIDRYGETKEIVHLQYDAKTGVYTVIKVVHKHGLKQVLTTEWQGSTNVYHYNFYDYQTYKVTVINGEKGADYSKYTNLNDQTFGDSKYHISGDGPFSTTGWAEIRTGEWNPNYVRIPDESDTQFNEPDRAAPIWLTGEMKIALIPLLNAIGQVGEPSEKKQIEINAVTTHIGRLEIQANAKKLNVELRSNKKEKKYEKNSPVIDPGILPKFGTQNLIENRIKNLSSNKTNSNANNQKSDETYQSSQTTERQLGFR